MNPDTTRRTGVALGCLLLLSLPSCGHRAATASAKSAETQSLSANVEESAADAVSAAAAAPEAAPLPEPPPPPGAPPPNEAPPPAGATKSAEPARPNDFLIYEATLSIAVYQVDRGITDLLAIAKAVGGQVVQRGDDRVVFRVPRARFEEALGRADAIGDVLHRDVHAQDVGDEYRDLEVRLRNARAMRDRLEHLLARAGTVRDSLEIEAQMSRVTEDIERLSGQLQLLGHRIAYSRITVVFQPRHAENLRREVVRLPFPWLDTLGLGTLLNLRE